jgi:hypothetical protein
MISFLRLFTAFRELEARCDRAEKAMEDYADEAHDAQMKLECLRESEKRMFEDMQLQAKRREDWWAMNAHLAPIHYSTPDHPKAQVQPDMEPVPGKRLARDIQNEYWEKAALDLERQMRESTGLSVNE